MLAIRRFLTSRIDSDPVPDDAAQMLIVSPL
jgi:hypothetical protein